MLYRRQGPARPMRWGHALQTTAPRRSLSITSRCLSVLCAAGGFNPGRVLPCVIDVGTNNELLRSEPWWVG